jgi:nudix-type nucleoside diphosphatase (YffH/AdpP family)
MRRAAKIVANEILAKDWGTLRRYTIDYTRRDGTVQRHKREVYDHGMAAAVLLYCPEREVVTLVRQFRLPPFLDGRDGFLLEVCAGLLDGDTPEACARREAEEEAGIRIGELRHAFDTIMSPGSLTETVSCFVGIYGTDSIVSPGGGLEAEGEDIEIVELPVAEVLAMIADGRIIDAKTILLLQHLALGRGYGS